MLSVAHLFVFSVVIVSTQAEVSQHNPFYCYSEDPVRQWTGLGGIHSIYEPTRGQTINANVSTCNPSKLWMLGRHGPMFPLVADVADLIRVIPAIHSQILQNYNQGRTSLCASDFELIRNWQFDPNVTMDTAGYLSFTGWNEMEALARRFQVAFPTILTSTYSPSDYFFRADDSPRTIYSLRAFADGLFGVNSYEQVQFEDIPEQDFHLRPYVECPLYLDNRPVEQIAFMQGPEYQQMMMQVSAKLGFHNSNVLRESDIALLTMICQYEQMWNLNYSDPSPFCAAFSVSNAQVIEYYQDMYWFHRIAYGKPEYRRLYENLSCVLLQDFLRFIQSNDANDHKVKIFSGHPGAFIMLLHFDGFAGDAILTRHNFAQLTLRIWRDIFTVTANWAIIRYDCADGDNDLLFLFNERPMQIPGCDANGVCKQSLILERLGRYQNVDCMEIFCTNE